MKIKITDHVVDEYGYETVRYQDMDATLGEKTSSISQLGDFEGQSEDATFARDICKPSDYLNIINMAYEAGKRGETLEIEHITTKDD